ncbi:hypothetical protein SAMN05444409_2840 [Epilithonimonas zeae]|uniref:Uncharacterized protein n=1 Tax=Epilithonimonas zeae TaxID=1416779 RepID=A0A1N6INQ0_9FLAO|nr:hypothetical protein SAMN05444409_2840 [Epilithonimonas zeae]
MRVVLDITLVYFYDLLFVKIGNSKFQYSHHSFIAKQLSYYVKNNLKPNG